MISNTGNCVVEKYIKRSRIIPGILHLQDCPISKSIKLNEDFCNTVLAEIGLAVLLRYSSVGGQLLLVNKTTFMQKTLTCFLEGQKIDNEIYEMSTHIYKQITTNIALSVYTRLVGTVIASVEYTDLYSKGITQQQQQQHQFRCFLRRSSNGFFEIPTCLRCT